MSLLERKNERHQIKVCTQDKDTETNEVLKNFYGPSPWIGFNCFKAVVHYDETVSTVFTSKFPLVPGTHLIGRKDERLSRPWSLQVISASKAFNS